VKHIYELVAENFKKIRVVAIQPNGQRVVMLTGKNGQGKSSLLDALWFGLKGQKALPNKKQSVIRNGADRMKVKLNLGECTVIRSLGREGNPPTLTLQMNNGTKRDTTPQDFLDDLFTSLTFDPLEFIRMSPADQVAELRKTAKVDVDFEAMAVANKADYNERYAIKKQADLLEGQIKGMNVLQGLPKDKLDESAILKNLEAAGELNRRAQEIFAAKQKLGAAAAQLGVDKTRANDAIEGQEKTIALLKKELERAEAQRETLKAEKLEIEKQWKKAEAAYQAAPSGEPIDVTALTVELQAAQRTNRAIDARAEYDKLQKQIEQKRTAAEDLTRRMEAREEKKCTAMAKAKIPVEGLTFDESEVKFNGIPLENLGEGEQIRISTLIGMAGNPKLRVLCIRHGEALDEEGLKVIAELAEQHDFQVWMARVDSSGKVGIVLEDGMVVARNEEATAEAGR
jgi:hypothetical protein